MLAIAPLAQSASKVKNVEGKNPSKTSAKASIDPAVSDDSSWMKQKAEEVRAVKERLRAARCEESKVLRLSTAKGSSACVSSDSKDPKTHMNVFEESEESTCKKVNSEDRKLSGKADRPRWAVPARPVKDIERISLKELEFRKQRERAKSLMSNDEIERSQQAKLSALNQLRVAWWERDQFPHNDKVCILIFQFHDDSILSLNCKLKSLYL